MRIDPSDLHDAAPTQEQVDLLHRARVADALIEVLCERGYSAATVNDIAARAVMSSRTFYRLYDNKADAFADVHERLRARACVRMRAAMRHHADPLDQICAALVAVLDCVDEHPRWGRAFVADGPAADGAASPLYLATIQGWLEAVSALLPDPGDMTRVEQGAAVCGILRARLDGGDRPASQLLPVLTQVLLGERVERVAEASLDGSITDAPPLTWDALVQAVLDHDVEVLAAMARAGAGDGDGGGEDGDDDEARQRLAAIAQAAAVGRHGGAGAVLALLGHRSGDGLPSRQALRCMRYVAVHPGTSGRGVLRGLGFRNESQVSRLLSGLAARGLITGTRPLGGARAWTVTPAGASLLRAIGLADEPDEPDTPPPAAG